MNTNEQKKIEFIHNPEFVKWVLKPTNDSNRYWNNYIAENLTHQKDIEHTIFLIKGLVLNQKSLSESDVLALWNKIKQTGISTKRTIINLKRWSVAASILIILGISGWFVSQRITPKTTEINYQSIAIVKDSGNYIKLILSDSTEKKFATKDVEFKYNREGNLVTKAGKQIQTEELIKNSETEQMNQLIVPRGKRSSIELADGTKLWLNSGSRAIYPVAFKGKTREIYIEGEGYLEVTHDATHPFYVVTDLIKVKVLGTKFNISAYKEDNHVSVVLIEGSVQTSIGTENLIMKPDQILNVEKLTQRTTLENTNVLEYVSWIDGFMICNKEQIQSITTKLSRYYDVKINYNDLNINNLTLTGKLDLKSNCEEVMKVICATAPLKYEIVDNTIYLTLKE